MAKKKELIKVFVSSSCGPCQQVKDAIQQGKSNVKEVDLIDIETEEGFPFIEKYKLTQAPSAYMGSKKCEILINREDNSIYFDCPTGKKPSRTPVDES